jgi:hypothetical protein
METHREVAPFLKEIFVTELTVNMLGTGQRILIFAAVTAGLASTADALATLPHSTFQLGRRPPVDHTALRSSSRSVGGGNAVYSSFSNSSVPQEMNGLPKITFALVTVNVIVYASANLGLLGDEPVRRFGTQVAPNLQPLRWIAMTQPAV